MDWFLNEKDLLHGRVKVDHQYTNNLNTVLIHKDDIFMVSYGEC